MELIGAKEMQVGKKKVKKQENTQYYKHEEEEAKKERQKQRNKQRHNQNQKRPAKPLTTEDQKEIDQIMEEENIKTLENVRLLWISLGGCFCT